MITQAEWNVMDIVWANPKIDAITIHKNLEPKLKWSISTVKTLISRLVKKNYLNTEKIGKTYFYSATKNKEELIYQKIDNTFDLICDTKQGEAMLHILDSIKLSDGDIQNIISKLEIMKLKAPKKIKCNCSKGHCQCKPLNKNL